MPEDALTAPVPPVLTPQHLPGRSLAAFVAEFGFECRGVLDGIDITGITLNSNEVQVGDLFVGVRGANSHGADFLAQAKDRGAVAFLTDQEGAAIATGCDLPIVVVDSPRGVLGAAAAWVYQTSDDLLPLLFGVTGTNGKTSTTYLLEAILKQLGLVTGMSSTAERHIGDLTFVSRLTTPESSELHALLARMRESGVQAAAIEVSAQALSQCRIDGLVFDVVAFTNLSHDHLDDYANMEEYFAAKLALFDPEHARRGVVSLDSDWGQHLVERSRIPVTTVSATPGVVGDWNVQILREHFAYTAFRLTAPDGASLTTCEPVIGRHMAANAALAIVMLVEAGFEFTRIADALRDGISAYLPGRTERVSGETGPSVYVDFGHSADAFLKTLTAVRTVTPGNVIMVFGADGDRDATKRHEMGRVASEWSDILVITDHHPRFEDPASIRATLIEGAHLAEHEAELYEVGSPEQAIRRAVSLAGPGDAILWAGPGHQDYRDIRGVRTRYSARAEARAALDEVGWV